MLKIELKFEFNSIIIEFKIRSYYEKNFDRTRFSYMSLLSCDFFEDITFVNSDLFFQFLKSHVYDKNHYEITFSDDIILNVHDILRCSKIILVKSRRLFKNLHDKFIC